MKQINNSYTKNQLYIHKIHMNKKKRTSIKQIIQFTHFLSLVFVNEIEDFLMSTSSKLKWTWQPSRVISKSLQLKEHNIYINMFTKKCICILSYWLGYGRIGKKVKVKKSLHNLSLFTFFKLFLLWLYNLVCMVSFKRSVERILCDLKLLGIISKYLYGNFQLKFEHPKNKKSFIIHMKVLLDKQ